jgi:hypothetical protein
VKKYALDKQVGVLAQDKQAIVLAKDEVEDTVAVRVEGATRADVLTSNAARCALSAWRRQS